MQPTLKQRHVPACNQLSPAETSALLGSARTLQRAGAAGRLEPLLRGKNVGLLCRDDSTADALLFRHAALELGARVAHVPVSLDAASTPQDVAHTARMLGRLYDAVECQGMDSAVVQQVAREVEITVYEDIASPRHPTAALADQMGEPGSPADRRRCLLQAILLSTLA